MSIGWIMLALLERKLKRPSKLGRPPSYVEMIQAYISEEIPSRKVESHENEEEDREFVQKTTKKRSEMQAYVLKLYEEKMQEWADTAELMGEGMDVEDLTTRNTNKISVLPMRSYFYPYQVWFGQLCRQKRFVGFVLNWDHYFLAFWITTASLVIGFIFLFIPWAFVLRWTGRLFVWIILGPWMKFVDIYYMKKLESLSDKEKKMRERDRVQRAQTAFETQKQQIKIKKENACKLAAMKKHVFGRFIVSTPHLLKLDKYLDEPLYHSSAKPLSHDDRMSSRIAGKPKLILPGQRLIGTMVPENVNTHFEVPNSHDVMAKMMERKLV
eukprot:CAMPEP_0183313690 /NCGR_PEP_ID=MMETSP0160_2-20130417/46186_1 /TAXON_ID=2839 ORGANISM="Odontella Sinensis, Strain Grunow 1884" /NCGR_SAMPLE_ID=MMETSP0160_2 /ASSEMBLY_ACC=CAM_ASM_000250 /LENGTH=325 /DNA_ID=CAMNT_0025478831 /DNA_START=98 /DNA_END=1075 /DNA_ORIENTATION=-